MASAHSDTDVSNRDILNLFLLSVLLLFLELACIRWFPAHVLFLTFFTNMVLLACFLGMSVGCLNAARSWDFLAATPWLLAVSMVAALGVEYMDSSLRRVLSVGDQNTQMVFFGTEAARPDVAEFAIPIEVLGGTFFVLLALAFVGIGQELGRSFNRFPNKLRAYTVNVAGSVAGILLFAGCSWLEWSPRWWFLLGAAGLGYFRLFGTRPPDQYRPVALGVLAVVLAALPILSEYSVEPEGSKVRQLWSPYYRVDMNEHGQIGVNLIAHQSISSVDAPTLEYALPYLFHRDAGGKQFEDVLIIGAGSGNDVARALQWGARSVDAVEIDPVLQRIGKAQHPDRPYQDKRVTVHLDDGRNFLRATERKYDLIIYAMVDSLVLHTGYSNIRLESYLFTRQALKDVHRHLKPDGVVVLQNFYRQGWIVARITQAMEEEFGPGNPIVFNFPPRDTIRGEDELFGAYTIVIGGKNEHIHQAFAKADYWLPLTQVPGPHVLDNGFQAPPPAERQKLRDDPVKAARWKPLQPTKVIAPDEPIPPTTDEWPFLYLRRPMIPTMSLRSMAVMGVLAGLLIWLLRPRALEEPRSGFEWPMFFLGAGFMLMETRAVVYLALLWGSTWIVNSVVFLAVLVMILAANLFVSAIDTRKLWPYYVCLIASLLLNSQITLDVFLGLDRIWQAAGSCLLVFTPIFFAGVIFATLFRQTQRPSRALGANIMGAMVGGLSEYSSMWMGFPNLMLLAVVFYLLSAAMQYRTASALHSPADAPARP